MQRNNDREKDIICGNCGREGHSYRRCTAPITSLGGIIYKKNAKRSQTYSCSK